MDEFERKGVAELLRIAAELLRHDAEERAKRRAGLVLVALKPVDCGPDNNDKEK